MPSSSSAAASFSQMPPKTADLDETWAFLTAGVDHIMTKLETGLSFAGYTSLYTTVDNYCTSTKMHGSSRAIVAGTNLVGADLYGKLTDHFSNHFKPLRLVQARATVSSVVHGGRKIHDMDRSHDPMRRAWGLLVIRFQGRIDRILALN
ncbi:hypothetical protein K438DRAFT_2019544 [Mycena galopus ATCC 62051]|nr:hypothetical protein K438DRAFT_2019544 [Mycena galopus ATCC 62051]